MAIAYDTSAGGAVTTAATTFVVNISTAAVGSHVFMWVAWGLQSATFTAPAGWTQIAAGGPANTITCGLFYHKKQVGETNFTFTTGSAKGSHAWVSYTGLDQLVPYQTASSGVNFLAKSTTATTVATPAVTNTDATAWALAAHASRTSTVGNKVITFTPDGALTERIDQNNSASSSSIWTGVELADSNGAVSAASHSYTATASFSEQYGGGALIYLMPEQTYSGPQITYFTTSDWTGTGATKTITVPGAVAGDLIAVLTGGDNFSTQATASTVSTTGGSTSAWTEIEEHLPASTTGTWDNLAWATVSSTGTVTVSINRTQSTAQAWGGMALLAKNHNGIGVHGYSANSANETLSLAGLSANSAIGLLGIDWDHSIPVVAFTPSNGIDVLRSSGFTAVSWYAGYWRDQASGTRSYGIATSPTANMTIIAVEILAASSTTPITGSDGGSVAAADASAVTQVMNSTDGGSIAAAEVSTSAVSSSRTDGGSISVADVASILVTFSSTDGGSIAATDSSSIVVSLNAADGGSIAAADSSASALSSSSTDTGSIAVSESKSLDASSSRTDGGSIAVSDVSDLLKTIPATDGGSISVSDVASVTVFAAVDVTDTASIAVSESSSVFKSIDVTDTAAISASDVSTKLIDFPGSDGGSISVSESATVDIGGTVTKTATDGAQIAVSDVSASGVSSARTDTTAVSVAESVAVTISSVTTDTTAITITEQSHVLKTIVAFDTASITVSETSGKGVTIAVTASDSLIINLTETASANDGAISIQVYTGGSWVTGILHLYHDGAFITPTIHLRRGGAWS